MLIETQIWRSRQDGFYSKIRIYYWYVKHNFFLFQERYDKNVIYRCLPILTLTKKKMNSKENNMLTFTTHFLWSIASTINSAKYQNRTLCPVLVVLKNINHSYLPRNLISSDFKLICWQVVSKKECHWKITFRWIDINFIKFNSRNDIH